MSQDFFLALKRLRGGGVGGTNTTNRLTRTPTSSWVSLLSLCVAGSHAFVGFVLESSSSPTPPFLVPRRRRVTPWAHSQAPEPYYGVRLPGHNKKVKNHNCFERTSGCWLARLLARCPGYHSYKLYWVPGTVLHYAKPM